MSYVALYRKARPQTFDEVKGQDHIVTTLRNQIKTGRLQHAYLFCGTRGTGKTTVAKILARAVNCENPQNGSPCNECPSCRRALEGSSMNVIEIDAASNNGVDNIREIIDEVQYRPTEGKYKVYIIDEVHMLSAGAFNALLKTLEEPPSYVIFILATTEVGKVPITIRSRCQRYDFHRIDVDTIVDRMKELTEKEGVTAEDRALRFIARAADGSMRDGLSLLDQCMAFYMGETLTYEKVLAALGEADTTVFGGIVRAASRGDTGRVIRIFEKQISSGMEISQFVSDFVWYLRNLLMAATSASREEAEENIDISGEQMDDLMDIKNQVSPETIMRYIRILSDLQNQMRSATNRRVLTEVALIRLSRPQTGVRTDDVLDRIRQMETKLDEITSGRYALPVSHSSSADSTEQEGQYDPLTDSEPEKEAENAAPEDLKKICAEWKSILGMLPNGFGYSKTILNKSIPQYDASNPDNHTLYIECPDSMAEHLVTNENLKRALEDIVRKRYQKKISVELHMKKDTTNNLKAIDVDQILSDRTKIGMQVDFSDTDMENF